MPALTLTPALALALPNSTALTLQVLCIFETFTAYAEYFIAINEEWETNAVAEKHERATRVYRAGMPAV